MSARTLQAVAKILELILNAIWRIFSKGVMWFMYLKKFFFWLLCVSFQNINLIMSQVHAHQMIWLHLLSLASVWPTLTFNLHISLPGIFQACRHTILPFRLHTLLLCLLSLFACLAPTLLLKFNCLCLSEAITARPFSRESYPML